MTRVAVDDPRERAICRALLLHALALLDQAERNAQTGPALTKEAGR